MASPGNSARRLASGGETLRLSSADNESARVLAAEVGRVTLFVLRIGLRGSQQSKRAVERSSMELGSRVVDTVDP